MHETLQFNINAIDLIRETYLIIGLVLYSTQMFQGKSNISRCPYLIVKAQYIITRQYTYGKILLEDIQNMQPEIIIKTYKNIFN